MMLKRNVKHPLNASIIYFIVTVVGGVVCHLIPKWLDGNGKDNE